MSGALEGSYEPRGRITPPGLGGMNVTQARTQLISDSSYVCNINRYQRLLFTKYVWRALSTALPLQRVVTFITI